MRLLFGSAGACRQCAPASPGRRGHAAPHFTVRRQMCELWRSALIGVLVILLTGCGTDPGSITLADNAALDDLAQRGAPLDERRLALSQRGYACSDAFGTFAMPDGSTASASKYISCTKTLSESLICKYHVEVILVPHKENGADTYFMRQEKCL